MPAFSLRSHSPDGAATDCGDIKLQLTAHLSTPKGWKAEPELAYWLTYSGHKWSSVSYRWSAGQRKLAGQRPTFYRWAGSVLYCRTVPTIRSAFYQCLQQCCFCRCARCDSADDNSVDGSEPTSSQQLVDHPQPVNADCYRPLSLEVASNGYLVNINDGDPSNR